MSEKWRWWVAVGGYGQGLTRATGGPPTDLHGDAVADYLNNLEAECARLREALRPFVAMDIAHYEDRRDDWPVWGSNGTTLTVGDFKLARAALEPTAEKA